MFVGAEKESVKLYTLQKDLIPLIQPKDLDDDDAWSSSVVEEDDDDELDMSDADVLQQLEMMQAQKKKQEEDGGAKMLQDEVHLSAAEKERLAEERRRAEEEAALLLHGDVLPPKNEKVIIRDLFGLLSGKGGGGPGCNAPPNLHIDPSEGEMHVFSSVVGKFEKVQRQEDGQIEVHTFSNAVLELTNALDALGGWIPVHSFVRNDIVNNVRKVNLGCQRTKSDTLQGMVDNELKVNVDYFESGREALLWLKRTLQFVRRVMLYCYEFPDVPLRESVNRAYREALAPSHNWAIRPIFGLCLRGIPNRTMFLERLGNTEADSLVGIRKFLDTCGPIISSIVTFFNENKLEDRIQLEI